MKTSLFNQKGKKVITYVQNFIFEVPQDLTPDVETFVVSEPGQISGILDSILGGFFSGRKTAPKKKVVVVQDVCESCAAALPYLFKRYLHGAATLSERYFGFLMEHLQNTRHNVGTADSDVVTARMVPIGEKIAPFTGLFAEAAYLLKDEGQVWMETPAGNIIPISNEVVSTKLREIDGAEIKLENVPLVTRDEIIAALGSDEVSLPDFPEGVFKVAL